MISMPTSHMICIVDGEIEDFNIDEEEEDYEEAAPAPVKQMRSKPQPQPQPQVRRETVVRSNPPEELDAPGDLFTEPTIKK